MTTDWYFDEKLWKEFYGCMFSPAQFALAEEQVEQIAALIGRETLPNALRDLVIDFNRRNRATPNS